MAWTVQKHAQLSVGVVIVIGAALIYGGTPLGWVLTLVALGGIAGGLARALTMPGNRAALAAHARGVTPAAYVCPYTDCGAISHHPMDKANRYCGRCHRWGGDIDGGTAATC